MSEKGTKTPERILLHVCCAPCATSVIETLSKDFQVTAAFYNPNIYPEEEYRLRLNEMKRFSSEIGVELIECTYDPGHWFKAVEGLEDEPEGGERCRVCLRTRLVKTASVASELGIPSFTTTLTVSPRKDASLINSLGKEIGECFGLRFLEEDFKKRDGFKRSVELSSRYNLYRQDYCGCAFSRMLKGKADISDS